MPNIPKLKPGLDRMDAGPRAAVQRTVQALQTQYSFAPKPKVYAVNSDDLTSFGGDYTIQRHLQSLRGAAALTLSDGMMIFNLKYWNGGVRAPLPGLVANTPEGLTTHEYGHHLFFQLRVKVGKTQTAQLLKQFVGRDNISARPSTALPSPYAGTSVNEWLAEAFTARQFKKAANPAALALAEEFWNAFMAAAQHKLTALAAKRLAKGA